MKRQRKPARRDKNKPKKVLTPYMFFVKENRNRIMTENPQLSFNEIMGEVGRQWGLLGEEDREPYKQMSLLDRKRYID